MKHATTLIAALALLGCSGGDRAPATPQLASFSGEERPHDDHAAARADDEAPETRPARRRVPEEARPLVRALEARLTVRTRHDGTKIYSRHCEDASVGCRQRILALASILHETAEAHDLDPFLLAALAVRESMLNPAALGRNGEAGILQLHPRGAGQGMRYVLDEDYREQCQSRPGACQRPVVERAATYLSDSIESCGGVVAGLGRYASGRCGRAARHARRVLEERNRLRELAE